MLIVETVGLAQCPARTFNHTHAHTHSDDDQMRSIQRRRKRKQKQNNKRLMILRATARGKITRTEEILQWSENSGGARGARRWSSDDGALWSM